MLSLELGKKTATANRYRRLLIAWKKGKLAEEVGFEPTVGFPTPVFKTGAFDHSATPPVFSASSGEDGETFCRGQEKVVY